MKKNTIFVSIASYRDKICPITLKSIYENASRPYLVFVGICQQNEKGDIDCIEEGLDKMSSLKPNVRVLRMRHNDAKGPTFARYLCSTLYQDEEYYLQIDSHCKFIKDWDLHLIKMIKDLKKNGISKPVLSHYTPMYENYNEKGDDGNITTICESWFTDQNMISLKGANWVKAQELPQANAYIAAGMFFCEAKFLNEVPFDPELDFLFIGEELLLSVRFYTNGWDIFTPNKNTIYHLYTRAKEPKYWENKGIDAEQASKKVRFLLGLDLDQAKLTDRQRYSLQFYGLGQERTLDEYYEHAGIDIKKKKILKNMCNLPLTTGTPSDQEHTRKPKKKKGLKCACIILLVILLLFFILICIGLIYRKEQVFDKPITRLK